MGVGLASFFSRASQQVGNALLAKQQQKWQQQQQEINVLQSIFASPQATDEQRALAVIGLETLQKGGKPGAGLAVFQQFATSPELQKRTAELISVGQSFSQQGSPAGVMAAAGAPVAGAVPQGLPPGMDTLGPPAPAVGAADPIDPQSVISPPGTTPGAMPPGIGPAVVMGPPGTAPVSGGPPAPGSAGAPVDSELIPGTPGQLAVPAMAGAASGLVNQGGQESAITPTPTLAPTSPAAAGGPPQPGAAPPLGVPGADPTATSPTAGPASAGMSSQEAFWQEAQRLQQESARIEVELQTVQRQIASAMAVLMEMPRTGIFGVSSQDTLRRQHAKEMLTIFRESEQQLNDRKQKILERHSMVTREAATQLAQNERTAYTEGQSNLRTEYTQQQANRRAEYSAGARIQAAKVGAETRNEADDQRARRKVLTDLNNLRQRVRAATTQRTDTITRDYPPDQRDEGITAQLNEAREQGLAQVNAAIADALGSLDADFALGQAYLKDAGGKLQTALAKARAAGFDPDELLWTEQSIYAAYLRTPEGLKSTFDAEYLLK